MIERINTTRNGKASHYYKIDGKRAIGVTTALNGIPKDSLKYWAAREVATFAVDHFDQVASNLESAGRTPTISFLKEIPFQKRDDAAIRGTEIHLLAERYVRGEEIDVPDELMSYVQGFVQYINDFDPKPIHNELVVASRKYGYAGTLDSIEELSGFGRCLVDWKTGNDIHGDFVLQVAGYRYADVYLDGDGNECPLPPVDRTFILHIKPGEYELIDVKADEIAFAKFLVALENYRENVQSNKLKKLIGDPVKPIDWEAA